MTGNLSLRVRSAGLKRWFRSAHFAAVLLLFCVAALSARAAIQFDVFLGYEGIIPEASWFPVVFEIKNDGPSFTGTVELDSGVYNQGQTRRLIVELPTGTLKRVVLPVFSNARGYSTWDVRLLDERGRVRAEQLNLKANKQTARGTPLLGALSRSAGGAPQIRKVLSQQGELQPATARLMPQIFPDNPLVLEGLNALYLNSERAADLGVNQVNALLAWLHSGGHLVVAVEQPSEITAAPWLKALFPVEVNELRAVPAHPELQDWLRAPNWPTNLAYSAEFQRGQYGNRRQPQRSEAAVNCPFADLPNDFTFEAAELQVATGRLRDGAVQVSAGDVPLIVTANRGRGRITALLFSPEREPMRSWRNLPTFWAKVAEVPGAFYISQDIYTQGGWSSDGIFGAMIDTRQVHKLPIGWLLLLLLVYLVVIGPLDQYWLKRIGRPMLTWITFPCYVVAFSLVIYFIGYKLRSGESEWNEFHIVDVLPRGEKAELRGRTYSSVYSPSNQRYRLESRQKYATLRGEFAGMWAGGQSSEKATVVQSGDNFKAEIFVPVWTSQLFVSDWWQSAAMPLAFSVHPQGEGWQVVVENHTGRKLTNVQVVVEDQIIAVDDLPDSETKTINVSREKARPLRTFANQYGSGFQSAAQARQQAFGQSERARLSDMPNNSMAASFLSQALHGQNMMNQHFIAPPGLDLSQVVANGNAVLLAWAGDFSPVTSLNQFSPRRSQRHTLWRVTAPLK